MIAPTLTRSQQKLLDKLDKLGEAWVVPSQRVMCRTLASMGLLTLTSESKFDKYRNVYLLKVLPRESK